MATPEILDFERLLAPISEEAPGGVELKEDATLSMAYYQVKDARESARSAERQLAQYMLLDSEEQEFAESPPQPDSVTTTISSTTSSS